MPYLSDADLSALTTTSTELARSGGDDAPALGALPLLGSLGVSGLMGLVRSKLEDPATGRWNVPGTSWDAEAVLFALATAISFGGKHVGLGQWSKLSSLAALGIGAHYMGEIGRRFGKTGRVDFMVGSGVPPWDPTSFDPTQLSDPFEDPQAQGLSSSGV